MKKILLINFGGLGDEILFLPLIKTIREEYPKAYITLALEKRGEAISQITNLINNTITVEIKKQGALKYVEILTFILKVRSEKYDMVISTGSSPRVSNLLKLTGIKTRIGYKSSTSSSLTSSVELNKNQYAAKMYYDLLKPLSRKPFENPKIEIRNPDNINHYLGKKFIEEGFIAIHPGVSKMSISKKIYKCPDPDFWIKLIDGIIKKGKNVVLLGGSEDEEIIKNISKHFSSNERFLNLFSKIKKLIEVIKIINKSETFISVDSAPMHMAVAIDKRLIAIFGPTDETKLLPNDEKFIAIKNDVKCRPCLWDKRNQCCNEKNCLNIDVNQILEKI